ncbi:MAG: SAF domain-containing protein, partial [Desulfotomaculales bacterium]
GATIVEKHFTISRADGGIDAAFSLEPAEMQMLVTESERAWQALGRITYGPTEKEKASIQYRRSLYVVQDMQAGDAFTKENLRAIRPGFGLPPRYYDLLLGKKVNRDVKKGTPLSWDLLID